MIYDLAVAGGGAAGLSAAVTAAKRNLTVAVLEKNDRIGKKLLSTGNGRCNLASSLPTEGRYNTDAVEATFSKVPLSRILGFFEGLGLAVREEDGRYYPYSNQASTLVNAFRKAIEKYRIDLFAPAEIKSIKKGEKFILDTQMGTIECRNLVFATGSEAGGGQNSLELLSEFGHRIIEPKPALVPLLTDTGYLKGLRGVRADVRVTLLADGKPLASAQDEILFKDNGVSGTAIFALSQALARARNAGRFELVVDFAPDKTTEGIARIVSGPMGTEGLFHKEIAANIARYAAKGGRECDPRRFAEAAKDFHVSVYGLSAFSLAQVASGGLERSGFDFETMESRLCKGLFAAGEALDVDGDCGGFNLMWAWASGILAGENVK